MRCLTTADLIPAEYRPSGIDQPLRSGLREHDQGLGAGRVRAGPVPDHPVHRRHRHRRRHVQARTADGPLRHPDQQDLAEHRAVHDQHRHHPQLGRLPDRGPGQHRPRADDQRRRHEPGRARRPRARGAPADRSRRRRCPTSAASTPLHRRPRRPAHPRRRRPAAPSTCPTTTATASTSRRRRSSSGWRTASSRVRHLRHALSARLSGAGTRPGVQPQILRSCAAWTPPRSTATGPNLGYRVYLDKAIEIAATTRPA